MTGMAQGTGAVEAVVRDHHGMTPQARPVTNRGAFAGRQVSQVPRGVLDAPLGYWQQARTGGVAWGWGECRSLCSRLTAAAGSLLRFLEPPFLRDLEMLAGGSLDERKPDSRAGPERSPRQVPDRDAELEADYGQLEGLVRRSDIPAVKKRALYRAVSAMVEIERRMPVADAMLKRSQREMLTDTDRRDLCALIRSIGSDLWAVEDLWNGEPVPVPESDALALPEAAVLQELQHRWQRLHDRFYSNDMPWKHSMHPIGTRLGGSPCVHVSVNSCIVPGAVLGTRFTGGYPLEDFADPACLARYWHVSGLRQSVLTDAGGGLLFRGLHHDIFQVDEPQGELFDRVGDEGICELVERLLFEETSDTALRQSRQPLVLHHVEALRSHGPGSESTAEAMRASARINLAGETVAAALVADPERFQRSLAGEAVDLDLFSIAVVTPDDHILWCDQSCALSRMSELRADSPVTLYLRDRHGAMRAATVRCKIRQFPLFTEPGELGPMIGNVEERTLQNLLGPPRSPELGGDVLTRVEAMKLRAAGLRAELAATGWRHARACPLRGAHHQQVQGFRDRLSRHEAVAGRLEKNARTLEDAGRQLKGLWQQAERWPAGAEQIRQVGARLALVGHLTGGMPLLSCAGGRLFTRELDAEIKFLATVADHRNGRLLPPDGDETVWGRTRNDFRPQ